MTVYCHQAWDGVFSPEYVITKHYDGQTDEELVELKYISAVNRGWIVEERTATSLHLSKLYPDLAAGRDRVDRYITIRG